MHDLKSSHDDDAPLFFIIVTAATPTETYECIVGISK